MLCAPEFNGREVFGELWSTHSLRVITPFYIQLQHPPDIQGLEQSQLILGITPLKVLLYKRIAAMAFITAGRPDVIGSINSQIPNLAREGTTCTPSTPGNYAIQTDTPLLQRDFAR